MADQLKVKMGACEIYLGGVNMGYTSGGVKVSYSLDTFEKTVDQVDTAIDEIVTKQNFEVTIPFAEYNLAKFVKFFPGSLLLGDNAVNPDKMKLILTGAYGGSLRGLSKKLQIRPKGGTQNDWITVYHAIPKPNIEFSFEKENIRTYNVTFKALQVGTNWVVFGNTALTSATSGVVTLDGDDAIPSAWYDEPGASPAITSITPSIADGIVDTNDPVTWTAVCTGTPTDYLWDFGDGEQSAVATPVHTTTTAGNYTVSLTVWNARGMATKKVLAYTVVAAT